MRELMAWADLAVTAGRNTMWELLFMGAAMLTFTQDDQHLVIVSNLQAAMNSD